MNIKSLIGKEVMVYRYGADHNIRLTGILSIVWCVEHHKGFCKVTSGNNMISFYEDQVEMVEDIRKADGSISIWEIKLGAGNVKQKSIEDGNQLEWF